MELEDILRKLLTRFIQSSSVHFFRAFYPLNFDVVMQKLCRDFHDLKNIQTPGHAGDIYGLFVGEIRGTWGFYLIRTVE